MKHALMIALCSLSLSACTGTEPPVAPAGPAAAESAHAPAQPATVPAPASASAVTTERMETILAGDWREPAARARDVYRHPAATLAFFKVRPDQTVIEITPGTGWYSEVLAPLLHDGGHYIAAVKAPASDAEANTEDRVLHSLFAADPTHYGNARIVEFDPKAPAFGPANSADRVLTFRNVHNWTQADTAAAMFKAFHTVLKPGGVLGVVDHRAGDKTDKSSGYLPVNDVVKLAIQAGFVLDGSSEINANPKDTRNWPKGVWTLPPTLTMGQKNQAAYRAIGESDRMTLRFVKPSSATGAQ